MDKMILTQRNGCICDLKEGLKVPKKDCFYVSLIHQMGEKLIKIGIITDVITNIKITEFPIVDRYSTGTVINKNGIKDCFEVMSLIKKNEEEIVNNDEIIFEEEIIDLDEVDDKILTIDDFLDDFKI